MSDPVIELEDALALVYDAQALVLKGSRANPRKEEKRRLDRCLAQLKLEETELIAMIDALEDGDDPGIQPPTDEQVSQVARLTAAVEALTRSGVAASEALALGGKVLDLAIDITGSSSGAVT